MLRSLRARLLIGALLWIALGVSLAGVSISALFRAQVIELIDAELTGHLDELSNLLTTSPGEHLRLYRRLSDPRFSNPGAGFYWQVVTSRGIALQSATLAGHRPLPLPIVDGAGTVRRSVTGAGTTLIAYERVWRTGPGGAIIMQIAADTRFVEGVLAEFNHTLTISLLTLALALLVAAGLQIAFGLAPMRRMRLALAAIRSGTATRLPLGFPSEVQPVVDDLNALLDNNEVMIRRARTQAGNLAHALKTPLAILLDEARCLDERGDTAGASVVRRQAERMSRQIDYQLTRARAAASAGTPGAIARVAEVLAPVVGAMERLYAGRELHIEWTADPLLTAAIDALDLSEVLANLIDNACKWAATSVRIAAVPGGPGTTAITIDDDGPGVAPEYHDVVFGVGNRLDERVAGSGLGLSIVRELVELYGGKATIAANSPHGLRATITLPTQ